jgi:hypothetical protein
MAVELVKDAKAHLDADAKNWLRLSKRIEFVLKIDTSTKSGKIASMMPDDVLQQFAQGMLDRVIADLNAGGSYAFFYYNELED